MAFTEPTRLTDQLIEDIADRIAKGKQVRRTLPPGGRIHIDRQLPFLFVYRPAGKVVDPGIVGLITSEASYLVAPAQVRARSWTNRLVERVTDVLAATFGGFLIIEIWGAQETAAEPRPQASFRVVVDREWADSSTVEQLSASLAGIRVMGRGPKVSVEQGGRLSPPGLPVVLARPRARELSTRYIGIEVAPIYRDAATGEEFPFLQSSLVRKLDNVFRRTAFEFARSETVHRPLHYQALGRRTFVRAVKEADRALSTVAESFDLLMTVTPINAGEAFRAFQRSRYTKPPRFQYRPRSIDPTLLKRAIYNAKVEKIEDPTLEYVFRQKQRELDLKLTLIGERERPTFLPTSIALYGNVDMQLVELAASLTALFSTRSEGNRGSKVDATTFAARAESEFERYRMVDPAMTGRVIVRDDIVSLMVSAGDLLVGSGMSFPSQRVEPLIQHEAGTHVVTYWNG
ncbi:MAG: DUF1704 domain-containing protein, partial [Acidimicrobiia bacterium]|nr:DUF1704 domain-containing protein [Acidimicrobiia bacterium]